MASAIPNEPRIVMGGNQVVANRATAYAVILLLICFVRTQWQSEVRVLFLMEIGNQSQLSQCQGIPLMRAIN